MKDLVVTRLNTYVVESGLKLGDRLPSERDLADALRVSRPTVREALRTLEAVGKLEIRKNAGSFVLSPGGDAIVRQLKTAAPIDIDSLPNLLQVRAAIEDRVVKLVAENPDSDLSEVRMALQQEADEMRRGTRSPFNFRFEHALGKQTGNPLLAELQRAIHEFWVLAWSECGVIPNEPDPSVLTQHQEILEAIERHDAPTARERMANHFERIVAPYDGQ
jgi:GntR family transcriptional repressor for pyruvate dehydrogenase complex